VANYHKFVFDSDKREFIGDFENMYAQESIQNFDSWHQDDSRQIQRNIVSNLLQEWQFPFTVDLGCGKGSFTHLLKKKNNDVLGLDLSNHAVSVASSRFPDIKFKQIDFSDLNKLNLIIKETKKRVNLFVCLECLSYLENWTEFLRLCAQRREFIIIALYLPENPIGFVNSREQLTKEFLISFDPLAIISLEISNFIVLFGKSKIV
jgi:trans-aconitate methyltransferase